MEEKPVESEKANTEEPVAEKPVVTPDSPKTEEPTTEPEVVKTEPADTAPAAVTPDPDTAASSPVVPPEHRPPITGFARPPRHRKRVALIIVIAVLVITAGGVAGYVIANRKQPPVKVNHAAVAPKKTVAKKPVAIPEDQLLAKFTTPTTGETWLAAPKKVGDLAYVDANDESSTTYYQVGAHGQNTIYMSVTDEGFESNYILYEKAPDGTVRAVLQPNANEDYSSDYNTSAKESLAQRVIADTTIHYDSLTLPNSLSIGHGETVSPPSSYGELEIGTLVTPDTDSGVTSTSVVQTYGSSKIVRLERKYTDTGLTAINYELDLPTGTRMDMTYAPVNKDLSTYTWSNGVTVPATTTGKDSATSDMSGIVRGCGSTELSVSWDYQASASDFVAAGKTSTGQTVYAFASNNNAMVQKAYSEYAQSYAGDSSVTVVPLSDFLKQHAIVAYKDGAGEWLVYTRDQYANVGGCAKPVVYLYPTHAENVTVHVGAKITKSDPLYDPSKGWSTYAQPSGQLTVSGKQYGSLFWEGQGSGLYPAVTSGTVVKRADALSTIKAQLKQQGLTQSESNDFVAYWQNKIPAEPYIRLTWFNTAEVNELAPLSVTPKPDTLIRVFLDMEGFTIPPKLPAQHLSSVPRNGFTVVEWGGLNQSALQ